MLSSRVSKLIRVKLKFVRKLSISVVFVSLWVKLLKIKVRVVKCICFWLRVEVWLGFKVKIIVVVSRDFNN